MKKTVYVTIVHPVQSTRSRLSAALGRPSYSDDNARARLIRRCDHFIDVLYNAFATNLRNSVRNKIKIKANRRLILLLA